MRNDAGKTCTGCKQFKPFEEYAIHRKARDGRQVRCKTCNQEYAKRRYAENRDAIKKKARWNHLKYRFGISQERYEALLVKQEGRCALCRTTKPGGRGNVFMVDHDHSCCAGYATCGECIRGLLCNDCNVGLSRFRDNPYLLNTAADYVKQAGRENGTRIVTKLLGLEPIKEA